MVAGAGEIYLALKSRLSEAGIDSAAFEARQLFSHVTGTDPSASGLYPLDERQIRLLSELTEKRMSGVPLQYLLGSWEFFGLPFEVGAGVLIPRADTELLAEKAIGLCGGDGLRVLDLCSGSGCIAIAVKKHCPEAKVSALEKSSAALEYLRRNIKLNGTEAEIISGDLFDLTLIEGREFEVIVSNPPYLTEADMASLQTEVGHEPETALFGGADGLDFYRFIIKEYKRFLSPGGVMMLEVGEGMDGSVADMFAGEGYGNIRGHRDYNGVIRVVEGKK